MDLQMPSTVCFLSPPHTEITPLLTLADALGQLEDPIKAGREAWEVGKWPGEEQDGHLSSHSTNWNYSCFSHGRAVWDAEDFH